MWREIHGGSGYLSMDPKEQHWGLGQATRGDLTIRWPNGEVQKIPGLKADRFYKIHQGHHIQVFQFSQGKFLVEVVEGETDGAGTSQISSSSH
jgi:hypothetical protein